MKKILIIMLSLFSLTALSQEQFCYQQNDTMVCFEVVKDKYVIPYNNGIQLLLDSVGVQEAEILHDQHIAILTMSDIEGKTFKERSDNVNRILNNSLAFINPVLIYEDSTIQLTHSTIIVQAKDETMVNKIFDGYYYSVKEIDIVNVKNYIVTLNNMTTRQLFDFVSKWQYDRNIIAIEPSFIRLSKNYNTNFNDTYFGHQWALDYQNNFNINTQSAWDITLGNNIKVAVFDGGVELLHPDLYSNMLDGYDATGNNTNGGYYYAYEGSHGTACAGIISASANNGEGIVGVAPNSKIVPIRFAFVYADGTISYSDVMYYSALQYAIDNDVRIFSNSWGGGSVSNATKNNIKTCANDAFDGKGCVILFSAGNNNKNSTSPISKLSDVMCVGAISPCGERKSKSSCDGENWGSNYGQTLDVVAPGVFISTTDLQGNNGYNTNKTTSDYSDKDYTKFFNGTSAACPHVSGVAALVLSVNPELTAQQVRDIIESTAQKVRPDLYTYSNDGVHNNGTWNNEMGYGLVDAYAAVKKAQEYKYSDLYVRDVVGDNGTEPSVTHGIMWDSLDIWIEDMNGNKINNPYGNAEYKVCVRVHNRSEVSSTGEERLFLNWAKAERLHLQQIL